MTKDEALRTALKKAYNLGQIYWQQADSEYTSQHRKADLTEAKFKELLEITVAALEAKDEPVAYPEGDVVGPCICGSWPGGKCLKCPRITPPQRKPLTDEECADLWDMQVIHITDRVSAKQFIRDIEAAHGIKEQS